MTWRYHDGDVEYATGIIIESLHVPPEFRRRGYARRILAAIQAVLRDTTAAGGVSYIRLALPKAIDRAANLELVNTMHRLLFFFISLCQHDNYVEHEDMTVPWLFMWTLEHEASFRPEILTRVLHDAGLLQQP